MTLELAPSLRTSVLPSVKWELVLQTSYDEMECEVMGARASSQLQGPQMMLGIISEGFGVGMSRGRRWCGQGKREGDQAGQRCGERAGREFSALFGWQEAGEGTVEDGDSLLHPILLPPGIPGSPVGCLGTAKSSEFTYYGVRDRWVKGALYLHGSLPGRASLSGVSDARAIVHGASSLSLLEAGLWWTLLSG